MHFPAGVLEGSAEKADVGRGEGGGAPSGRPRSFQRQAANGGRRPQVLQAAMHQARRHYQKVPAPQLDGGASGKLVGGGPIEQKEQFKALMGMPRHATGNVAADPADMDEHRQADLLARYRHRLVTHTYQRHFEAGRLTAAFNTVQRTVNALVIPASGATPAGGPGRSALSAVFKFVLWTISEDKFVLLA